MTPQQISKLFCDADTTMAGLLAVFEAGRAQARAELIAELRANPAAYLTYDEDGGPQMLFFDKNEAATYCAPDEEPEPLAYIPKE